MTLLLYSCFAIPMWCAMFALYFLLRRLGKNRASLIAKCAGSFLSVGSALFALYSEEPNPPAKLALLFFLLCTAADALLEISFLPGMGLFALGHGCLIVCLWQAFPPTWWTLLVWAAAMLTAIAVFRRELPKMGLTAIPACLYVAVLSCTLALSFTAPLVSGNWRYLVLAAGALCFFISDLMVAKQEFGGTDNRKKEQMQKPIMVLYWLALYLISATLWI